MTTPLHVLIADDSEEDILLSMGALRQGGYEVMYERVDTPQLMAAALTAKNWDLVIADYTMPHFRGTEALQMVKERGLDVPFIFVSGTISEETAVEAMKSGAHDYVLKGNLRRLLPAVERELREAEIRRERKLAEHKAQRHLERLRALYEIERAITSTLELQAVLYILLEYIDVFLPDSAVSTVDLLNQETGVLEPAACRNVSMGEWKLGILREGQGFKRNVIENKLPEIIIDLRTDPRTRTIRLFRNHALVSYVGVPLAVKDEMVGILGCYTKEKHEFSDEEMQFLSTLAGQAAIAISNARLYEQTKRQSLDLLKANEQLKGLNERLREGEETEKLLKEVHQDITRMELESLMEKLSDKVRDYLKVDICDIRVREASGSRLMAASGIESERLQSVPGQGRARLRNYAETKRPLRISDLSKESSRETSTALMLGVRGYLGAPFFSKSGQILGIMRALTYQPRDFSEQEADLLQQLANGAAIAIENAQLYRDLEESDKIKSDFLSVMSHELRTPLSVILGYSALLKERVLGDINSEQEKALEKVIGQLQSQLAMVNGILQATQIEAGTVGVVLEDVDLSELLGEIRSAVCSSHQ
jgi:GAF domain-containing protein